MADEPVFALDVGTRKVAGLLLVPTSKGYHIQAAAIVEHQQRAMLDGQIHDISEVAQAIQTVKAKLEKKTNKPLQNVAVAAAGRALKTLNATAVEQLASLREITAQDVLTLETAAVQEAEEQLIAAENRKQAYHCVGYSVVWYQLDGTPIANLVGQTGETIAAEIIATFLPRTVVDSLVTALQRAGLAMDSLTLEPIAASAVVIPAAMRGLNLVLVDIGAGTSDIALTGEGTITGYAMVPTAGDEISEAISQALLVDFDTAEIVKRQLGTCNQVTFVNVMGQECTMSAAAIIEQIKPAVLELARQIANQILLVNKSAPQAVLLIGGGSLTPGIAEALANQLEISPERVAVRGREALKGISGARNLKGPQAITPIGIAVTALQKEGLAQARITVNGRLLHLLASRNMNVSQALLSAGIPARQLYGRPGKGMGVEVNGRLVFLKGQPGEMGKIEVNGRAATLDTLLKPGDEVKVIPGKVGADARGVVRDVVPELAPKTITINGRQVTLQPQIIMNGNLASYETPLQDQARIVYEPLDTIAQVLENLGQACTGQLILNGQPVKPETPVKDGDILQTGVDIKDNSVTINLNGKPLTLKVQAGTVLFADIFNYLDFPTVPPPGKNKLVMKVNNHQAEYTTPLAAGDTVILRWDA
ncbi:MAG: hypothetical protein GX039_04775 [Clostridia bacterium]|nr:hypothetical protein [Clostridia bacterium]